MKNNQDYVYLGKILKPFSYKGELKIFIEDLYIDYFLDINTIFIDIQGSYTPFAIKSSSKNKSNIFRISLDGIDSESLAKALKGNDIYIQKKLISKEVFQKNKNYIFIDYKLYDNNLFIGKVIEVIQNKNQVLVKVVFNEKNILIPLVDEFIIKIDKDKKKLIMNLPEGLKDL